MGISFSRKLAYLARRVAVVVFVLISQGKFLRILFLYFIISHLLTHTLHKNTHTHTLHQQSFYNWSGQLIDRLIDWLIWICALYSQHQSRWGPSTVRKAGRGPQRSGCCASAGWSKPGGPSGSVPPQSWPGMRQTGKEQMEYTIGIYSLLVLSLTFFLSFFLSPFLSIYLSLFHALFPKPKTLSVNPCTHQSLSVYTSYLIL